MNDYGVFLVCFYLSIINWPPREGAKYSDEYKQGIIYNSLLIYQFVCLSVCLFS